MRLELQCNSYENATKLKDCLDETTNYYSVMVVFYGQGNCTVRIETQPMGHILNNVTAGDFHP